jgi:hypothetical protein
MSHHPFLFWLFVGVLTGLILLYAAKAVEQGP